MKHVFSKTKIGVTVAAAILWASLVPARADNQLRCLILTSPSLEPDEQSAPVARIVTAQTQGGDDDQSAPIAKPAQGSVTLQAVEADPADPADQAAEADGKKKESKRVTWLGVAVGEAPEALSSQLGLKPGEGLTICILASGSPAERADLHKNDVLVDLDGQMLVHPMQLRKLIQMHTEGDSVKLTFFRGGKKQTTTIKLGTTTWDEAANTEGTAWPDDLQHLQFKLNGLADLKGLQGLDDLDGHLRGVRAALERVGLDRGQVNLEVKHTMEQTRKAIQDAVRNASTERRSLAAVDHKLEALARAGVDVDRDATVVVRSNHNSSRTIVQTDEDGSYIIEAGAKTRLTAHDKEGKLLFEGEIDTPAEREKVPKAVWEKVKPMLDQIVAPASGKPKTEGRIRGRSNFLKQSACSCVISTSST
ncbi:MAG TPA: PDZ domain-containing protein [Verrucomicrobiae bacterium]|jgi:hypothetical protein|nr:PDZ domain-containing protein [Verrucomicrobiae bacterium]